MSGNVRGKGATGNNKESCQAMGSGVFERRPGYVHPHHAGFVATGESWPINRVSWSILKQAPSAADDRPSMYQDVVKGRRTEIDYLNGYVVARGKGTGVDTRLNEATTGLVKRLEAGELRPDPANLELLEPYV